MSVAIRRVVVGPRTAWLVAFLLPLLAARPGLAFDYEVAGGGSVGVTDNALAVPEGTPGSRYDAILQLQAEAALVWLRKYMEHTLGYLFTADEYVWSSGAETVSNVLRWEAAYEPLQWLRLTTDFSATQGTLSSADTLQSTGRAGIINMPVGPRPAQALRFLTLDGREGATFTLNPDWRLLQGLAAQAFWPIEEDSRRPSSLSGEASLGIQRTWERDGLSLHGRGLTSRTTQVSVDDAILYPRRRGHVAEGTLGWHHAWSPGWSHYAGAGAFAAWVPEDAPVRWKPSGQVELHARSRGSELALIAARTAFPDVYVGDIFLNTGASLLVGTTLDGPRRHAFRVVGRYDRSNALASEGVSRGSATVWQLRSIVSFLVKRPWQLTAEYAYTDQNARIPDTADPTREPPFRSFHRHLFLVGVELRYSTFPAVDGSDRERRGPAGAPSFERSGPAGDPREDPRE